MFKANELILAKCIKTEAWGTGTTNLELGKYYVVEALLIGQSNSSVMIEGKSYNSIMFEYYDAFMNLINIYKKYSPYK